MRIQNLVSPRMLNERGLAAFEAYFVATKETGKVRREAPPVEMLFDDAFSTALPSVGKISADVPATKIEIGRDIDAAFPMHLGIKREVGEDSLLERPGVMEWIVLLWSDAFLKPKQDTDGQNVWMLGEPAKYRLKRGDASRAYRHYVWGPAMLYQNFGELARCILESAAQPYVDALDVFVWSGASATPLMQALDLLYVTSEGMNVDGAHAVRRSGANVEARAGGIADAIEVFCQLARTYSIDRMSPEQLVSILPEREFSAFKRNARQRAADGVPAPAPRGHTQQQAMAA